jgi:hypothetical protein
MMLEEMKIDFPLPAQLYEDNTGAIYLMNNNQVGPRTKHISVKFHHVRNMIYEGELETKYIKSGNNPSDIMTKNTPEAIQGKHEKMIKNGDILSCIVNDNELLCYINECEMVKCGQLSKIEDFPVDFDEVGAVYCEICDDYFVTSAHEETYKHLEYAAFEVLKEMAKSNEAKSIDAVNREDVDSVRLAVTHDSSGTAIVTDNCVNRSMNNDSKVMSNDSEGMQGDTKEEESLDCCLSNEEMVYYTDKTKSETCLSEKEYILVKTENTNIKEDAG